MQSPSRHGNGSWRSSSDFHPINDHFRQPTEFSFRNVDGAPQYPRKGDGYRPDDQESLQEFQSDRRDRQGNGPERHRTGGTRGNFRGGRANKIATAERPLLRSRQDTEPEQMFGIAYKAGDTKRFISADDMSDSEEELMEESESDNDNSGGVSLVTPGAEAILDHVTPDGPERPAKRRALEVKKPIERVGTMSKWSNPDPYTVLPPIDDTQRKKRDVVKIIRKARVSTEKAVITNSQAAANDDFISFGFEEGDTDTEENVTQKPTRSDVRPNGSDMLRVPTGPGQFSHRNNFRDQGIQKPPGSQIVHVSAEAMGPPPGLEARANSASNPNSSQDVDSGKRKPDYNERIRFNPLKRKRPAGKEAVTGDLTEDWWPEANTEVTPWLENEKIRRSENAGFRLHKEICDFYEFVRPQKYEQAVRENLLQRLQTMVRNRLGCNVHSFGSFAAGLYLPNADMDVVVISDDFANYGEPTACQSSTSMHRFAKLLRESYMAKDDSIEVIAKAKVPIIKFVDRLTSIKVDMSFENYTGISANKTFMNWKTQHPAITILVTAIKQFLMMRGLNEVVNGGLGGFSVTCLVTSLLQNMPRVQTGELVPEHHLGEILIEFLDFYGNQLDISRTGIMMDPPGYFDKCDRRNSSRPHMNAERLAIMDPNRPGNDISGGSHNVALILRCFSEAHMHIIAAMRGSNRQSLLEETLGGNYEPILWQRDHLRRVYEEQWGSPVQVPVAHSNYNNVRHGVEGNSEQRSRFPLSKPEQDARTGHQEQKQRTKMGKRQLTKVKSTKDKSRAAQLKRDYPHSGVPDSLSRPAFKNLLLRLRQQDLSKKAAKQPATVNSGGISLSNPILID